MTRTVNAEISNGEFDLDLRITEGADVVADLLRSTDDGCDPTCGGSCTSNAGNV
ncbi:FxLD family lanthipeptide [Kitasatospora sp. NPDC101801]|uniref:FxLD family lanthipeptide n=1 Tax=Kitasatospora sp. NPDC101801 TaxID=3364103 RepID=UPI0037FE39FD